MKRRSVLCAAGLAPLAAALLPAVFRAQPGSPQPSAPPATPRVGPASPAPIVLEIHQAIRSLEEAKHHLEITEDEFHGHRVRAIEHVNRALEECHKALEEGRG
jgi:hypothetical protein